MRGIRRLATVILALLALGAGGCESSGGGGGGPSRTSTRGPSGATYETRKLGARGTGSEFSVTERTTMDRAWNAYVDHSSGWPSLREQWKSFGPGATDVLVDNLLGAMIVAWLANYPEEAERARRELILLDGAIVPTVTGVLEDPTFADPYDQNRVKRLSTDIVTELVELLMIAQAEEQLLDLADSDVPSVRRASYDALGQLATPRGLDVVIGVLRRSGDWIDRVAAAKALAYSRSSEGRAALVAALRDAEDLVVIEAARSLAVRRDETALTALDSRRAEARAAGNHRLAAAMGGAAKAIREAP